MFRKILIFMVVVALLDGCVSEEKDKSAGDLDEGPLLVATTTIIADIARNLSGERMRVVGIMRPGEDPHIYDPLAERRPSDFLGQGFPDQRAALGGYSQ